MPAQIGLREFSKRIGEAIDNGRYATAVANAKHVLAQYPKCVAMYRLMARAALEAGQYDFAIDVLHRALSANPEDVIAWAGLSGVYERRGELDEAIWYLHRAVELTGGTGPAEEELRKLYAKRDGAEPKKVGISPAALAHVYMRGGLLAKAIDQFRQVYAEDPNRTDAALGLAEALWRDNQRVEAAQICLDVLDRLPYCLKANLILGQIWTSGGREDGTTYLQRAEAVDPENQMAQELFGSASPLPPKDVLVAAPETELAEGGELPEWLAGVAPEGAPAATAAAGEVLDIAAALEAQIEIPPWLEEVGLGDAAAPAGLPQPDVAPAAMQPERGAERQVPPIAQPPATAGGGPGVSAAAGEGAGPGLLEPSVTAPGVDEEPAWLAGLGLEEVGEDGLTVIGEEDQAPEWLAGLSIESAEEEPEPASTGAPEAAEWLQASGPEPAMPPPIEEEPVAPYAEDTLVVAAAPAGEDSEGELPEWLLAAAADVPKEPEAALESADEGLPEWLMEMGVQPAAQTEGLGGEDEALFEEQALAWVEGLTARQEEGPPAGEDAEAAMAELAALTAVQDASEPGIEGLATPDEATAAEAFGWTVFGEATSVAPAAEPPVDDTGVPPTPGEDLDVGLDWAAFEEEAPLITGEAEAQLRAETTGIAAAGLIGVPSDEEDFGWDLLGIEDREPAAAEPAGAEPAPAPPPPGAGRAPQAEEAFGWTAFGKMGAVASPDAAGAPPPEALEAVPEAAGVGLPPAAEAPAEVPPEIPGAPGASLGDDLEVRAAPPAPEEPAPARPEAAEFVAERAYLKENPRDFEAWLSLARDLWRAEQQEDALEAYGRLIRYGEKLDDVIGDLEKRAKKTEGAAARRALGDAYMKAGRLDEALDIYRRALNGL
jgi:tetratricopeptide (TPR) repeat protein